jgi:hypothetical protein
MPFTFQVPRIPLSRPAVPVGAFRYVPGEGYQPLASVRCVEVSLREGAEPSKAIFEYVSSNYRSDLWPIGFEDVLPIRRIGNPEIVNNDDRIVVATLSPDGGLRFLFDGFAQAAEVNWNASAQNLTFHAQGVECRLWDEVVDHCVMRDADDSTNLGSNVWTRNPIRFNPRIDKIQIGNQVDERWSARSDSDRKFSVFYDPLLNAKTVDVSGTPTKVAKQWSLFEAVNHLLTVYNWDEEYVQNMGYDYLSQILNVWIPRGDYLNPLVVTLFDVKPIIIPDTDISGKPMPEAVAQILAANGFTMCFRLGDDGQNPITYFDIYKLNDNDWSRYKDLYLQQEIADLNPGASNVSQGRMTYDISKIVNSVTVETALVRYEVGIILAPLFRVSYQDLLPETKKGFDVKNKDFRNVSDKYRLFGADECGEGHLQADVTGPDTNGNYTVNSYNWVTTSLDFTDVFGADEHGPLWVTRRRPPIKRLWTKDIKKEYMAAELYVSVNYSGPRPAIANTSTYESDWFKVWGGWELRTDRLGIWVTAESPNAWHTGKRTDTTPRPLGAGEIRLLDWLASEDSQKRQNFALMLLCTIESDQHANIIAEKRPVSPTEFEINRVVNVRSKFRPGKIHRSSLYYPSDTPGDTIDAGSTTAEIKDYASGKREAHQLGQWAGTALIPRLSFAYDTGDRIRSIVGRDCNMQTNLDANGQEAPVYPRVVGITYSFGRTQETHLILSDQRSDHARR